jgi:signal transduction histidine kinase
MKVQRNLSLYWRLLASYLLIILVGCTTLYVAGEAFAPIFFEQHMGGMMNQMRDANMMIGMAADLNEAYMRANQQGMFWGMTVSALVAGAVALFVTSRIVAPVKQMQSASERIASGQYRGRLNTQAPGEIGDLARSFNEMAQALEDTERRRVELLRNVAHELKTPLNSLHGYVEGIQDGVFQADDEILDACKRQITRMERLVQDLSLLSRVETGHEAIEPRVVKAGALINGVMAGFLPQANSRGVTLVPDLEVKNLEVFADPQRTGQVLSNLVANALRHTSPGGEIRLSVQQLKSDELVFRVTDTGEGIAPEDLPHVFTRFYRADKARTHDPEGGTGIGLTIAKHYVEVQGGRIGADSQLNQGSSFWFTLPTSPVKRQSRLVDAHVPTNATL